jgi:hypothetical protein
MAEFTINIPAGPISSNDDAQTKAPIVCAAAGGTWNEQWTTVIPGTMSVVGCIFSVEDVLCYRSVGPRPPMPAASLPPADEVPRGSVAHPASRLQLGNGA